MSKEVRIRYDAEGRDRLDCAAGGACGCKVTDLAAPMQVSADDLAALRAARLVGHAEVDRVVAAIRARGDGVSPERQARLDMISRLADAPWSTK